MIKPGDYVDTSIELKAVRGDAEVATTLGGLLTRPTVVSIYMRNNTGSCDKQNAGLIAATAEVERLGYAIMAVSRDSCGAHRKYAAKKGIGYTLVSDPDDVFARAVDAIVTKSMYGKTYDGPARSAYVLAPDGRVLAVIEKVEAGTHGEQVIEVLKGL